MFMNNVKQKKKSDNAIMNYWMRRADSLNSPVGLKNLSFNMEFKNALINKNNGYKTLKKESVQSRIIGVPPKLDQNAQYIQVMRQSNQNQNLIQEEVKEHQNQKADQFYEKSSGSVSDSNLNSLSDKGDDNEDQDLSPSVEPDNHGPKIKKLYEEYCKKIKINAKDAQAISSNSMNLMQIEMEKEREHLKNLELNSSHGGSSLGVDASKIQLEAPVFVQNK